MSDARHWDAIYAARAADRLTWYQPHLERSLAFIRDMKLDLAARIVDVGGGASTLVDDLLDLGCRNVAVIDLVESALQTSRERLGDRAAEVEWIVGDVTKPLLADRSVDLWHDRAVFHFLTGAARSAYVAQVERCVKPGGRVLIATFALDGPDRCSGLPVTRYDAGGIRAALGDRFELIDEAGEQHETPAGGRQSFVYALCRKTAG